MPEALSLRLPLAPLQPSLIQRELLTRTFQRAAGGDAGASSLERRELALRALAMLQAAPGSGARETDPLRQIGVERRRFGGALPMAGGRAAGMEFVTVRGRGGELRRQQWQAGSDQGPTLRVNMVEADEGFSRFDALTAEERSWAGAMRGMRRLELGGERLPLAGGRAELGLLELTEGTSRARRMALGFTGGRWSLRALSQRADESFQRLGDLADGDRKLFGAERGIARDALDLSYALPGKRQINASNLTLRAGAGTAFRRQFEYLGGEKLQLRLNTGRVDSSFDRIGDLLEPDRNALAPRKGTRWSDLALNLRPTRWLTTDNQWFRSASLETGQQSLQLRNLWTLQLAPRSRLSLLRNVQETPTGQEGERRTLTQSVRLEQWLAKTLFFSALRETTAQTTSDAPDQGGRRLALQVKTGSALRWQGAADYLAATHLDGQDERSLQWTLGLPLRQGLALQAKGSQRDAGASPGTRTLSLGIDGQLARAWNLSLALNNAGAGKGADTRDLGVRLTFAGLRDTTRFKETRLALSLGDTQGLAPAVPAVRKQATSPRPGVPIRRVQTLTLETKHQARPLALGYASAAGTAGGLIYRLATDPARRLSLETLREVRDMGRTSLVARERHALQALVAGACRLALAYESQPELSPGKLLLGHAQTRAELRTKAAGLDLMAAIAWDRDQVKGGTATLSSFQVGGPLDSRQSVSVSYTGRSGWPDPSLPIRDVRLAFERKPDEWLVVALHAQWQAWEGKRGDELAWQLDLTATF